MDNRLTGVNGLPKDEFTSEAIKLKNQRMEFFTLSFLSVLGDLSGEKENSEPQRTQRTLHCSVKKFLKIDYPRSKLRSINIYGSSPI